MDSGEESINYEKRREEGREREKEREICDYVSVREMQILKVITISLLSFSIFF